VIPRGEVACVWMTAGVLSFRLCDRNLECTECPLDLALRNAPAPKPVAEELPAGPQIKVPERVFLHPGHLWVRLRPGGEMEVGIDDLARRVLAPVTEVRLPADGDEVTGGLPAVTLVTRCGAVSVPAPFTGVVARLNPALTDRPSLLTESPYEAGWLFRLVSPDPMAALAGLLAGDEAADYLSCEAARARDMLDIAFADRTTDRPTRCEDAILMLPPRVAGRLIEKLLHCSVRIAR